MKLATFTKLTFFSFVFVPAVSSCGITEIAGDVDGGVGGQPGTAGTSTASGGTIATIGGNQVSGGARAAGGGSPVFIDGTLPCDVLQNAGNPCVAAHSTVRVIVSGYAGPLYQVCRGGPINSGPNACNGEAKDIASIDGLADSATQDAFCASSNCYITKIYDQTAHLNDLEPAPGGGNKPTADTPAYAPGLPVAINFHSSYGVLMKPGMGYRTGCDSCTQTKGIGMPVGDEPETIFMVTSRNTIVNGCCFDYGNAETTSHDDGNGTAEAVYFGNGVIWGTGVGTGPWVMADLENGLYAGWENKQDRSISTNTSLSTDFVTAVLVGDTHEKNAGKGRFALYGGDATSGALQTMYDGIRPEKPGYVPMLKEGSIVLGISGDNTSAGGGRFYEGAIALGAATQGTLNALQASIVAAGYGH